MADVVRIRTVFTGVAGSPWYSNIHFGTAAGDPEALAASNTVRAFWFAIKGLMDDNVSVAVQPDVTVLDPFTGQVQRIENVPQTAFSGTDLASKLPPANQVLVTIRTGQYRNGRPITGKIFIPGLSINNNSDGVVKASSVTTILAAANSLLAGVPLSAELGVLSRAVPGQVLPPIPARTGAFTLAQSVSVGSQFSVLRSRRD